MTRRIIALCLLILIPITLNCMASSSLCSNWAYAMAKGRMGDEWIAAFSLTTIFVCGTIPGVGWIACGVAGVA